ncbi:hypothetical protein SH2C18_11440 [Clostridium sediminicola]|uniref:small, acid-soluble spore protein, H family n=1 Tax=Clostridium sediminicola TaxID=3114879 RepID=UPI0031F1DA7F
MLSLDRARDIMKANSNIEVIFNNTSVWLEDINDKRDLVQVRSLSENECMVVHPSELTETGKVK